VCYRVANAAWKTYSLRKFIELFERDPKMHQKFLALRTNWVQAKTTGSSRVRLPAASVSRANTCGTGGGRGPIPVGPLRGPAC